MALPTIKADPKTLGVAQLMIGIMIFMFGFAFKNATFLVGVNSGIMFWGAICFLVAGSLSLATVDYNHPYVVKGALGMNILSALAAFIGLCIFSVDLTNFLGNTDLSKLSCNTQLECAILILMFSFFGAYRVILIFCIIELCMAIWTFVLIWKSGNSIEPIA